MNDLHYGAARSSAPLFIIQPRPFSATASRALIGGRTGGYQHRIRLRTPLPVAELPDERPANERHGHIEHWYPVRRAPFVLAAMRVPVNAEECPVALQCVTQLAAAEKHVELLGLMPHGFDG